MTSEGEAQKAARRIVAARGDWTDGLICARYILSIAPGKDVVEGARALVIAALKEGELGKALPARLEPLTQRVAALATAHAAREREACADKADSLLKTIRQDEIFLYGDDVGDAIRARTP